MRIGVDTGLIIVILLLYIDAVIICRIVINKLQNEDEKNEFIEQNKTLLNVISDKVMNGREKVSIESYTEVKQSISLGQTVRSKVEKHIDTKRMEKKYIRRLNSLFKIKRMEAVAGLGIIGTERARAAIERAVLREKNYPVKLYMANALTDIGRGESIGILVSSLLNSHKWYREKVNMLIAGFGEEFNSYLPVIIESDNIEIKELIVDFASTYTSQQLKRYLINIIDTRDTALKRMEEAYSAGSYSASSYKKLIYKAASIIADLYPKELDNTKYLDCSDNTIRNTAVKALSHFNSVENLEKLIALLKCEDVARSAVNSISRIIERKPHYLNVIVNAFKNQTDMGLRKKLADVLSWKIEYFVMKLSSKDKVYASEIIKEILFIGKTSEIMDFLNKNKDLDIENELLFILKDITGISKGLETEFRAYLDERLLRKLGMTRYSEAPQKKETKKDLKLIRALYMIMAATVLFFPVVYLIRHNDILLKMNAIKQLKIYVVDFNYYLAYYSIAINAIYLILLILSVVCVIRQSKLWKLKSTSLLFKKRMLPSISIIAPAYNEEKTIIESANSLLNLKYPDYELVIVNDGSKDNTLDVLIKYFDLVRVNYLFEYKLNTAPVRGIYLNRSIPRLIVVDKENGGKADSLNAGINISTKEYFCGIDADSLLESDALLKLASLTLDEGVETPALGGNIFPINGCTVERGLITDTKIPKNSVARLQAIEYIRAFMAGRLGWAMLNSLLIISGAFGLFRKERVIGAGGYLTSKGRYGKDTVGEDMELVVRISRLMRELKLRYRICYAFNANCWTEVPEDLGSLKKQRHRWHRGLIDILTFHKKMILNPSYGRTGMMAMPYFFLFEMVGPLVEIQGYIMVFAALLLGLLNTEIALLLFISTILFGVLVSISSLLIAEKDLSYFKLKDIMVLVLFSIIENFGPRQLFSFWRVSGYFSMLNDTGGWGKLERKGFASTNANVSLKG